MVWGVARVFFFKVCLYDDDDSCRVCRNFVGGWVPYGVELGLVFSVRL